MRRMVVRGVRERAGRLALALLGVAVAVAFVAGTHVVAATAGDRLDSTFDGLTGRADLVVRGRYGSAGGTADTAFGGGRSLVSADALAQVAAVPGVTAVRGRVQQPATVLGADGRPVGAGFPPTFGMSWAPDDDGRGWALATGTAPAGPTDAVVDQRTAAAQGWAPGAPVRVVGADGRVHDLVLRGTATYAGADSALGGTTVLVADDAAQRLFGEPGRFNWLEVTAAPGVDVDALRATVAAAAGADTRTVTADAYAAEARHTYAGYVDLFRRFLLAFAYLALVVGGYSAYNTFAIVVAQRRREIALLRALGAGRRQVVGAVVGEGAVVAVLAAAVGTLAGVAVAVAVAALAMADRLGVAVVGGPPTVPLGPVAGAFAMGVVGTVVASVLPAWGAARTPPVAALREVAGARTATSWGRVAVGLVAAVAGATNVAQGLGTPSPQGAAQTVGGLATALVGLVVLGPVLWGPACALVGRPLQAVAGTVGRLARANSARNPERSSRVATAVVVGLGLMTAFSVMTATLAGGAAADLEAAVTGDLVVHPAAGGPVPAGVADVVRAQDGVAGATGVGFGYAEVDDESATAIGIDPTTAGSALAVHVVAGSLADLAGGPPAPAAPAPKAQPATGGRIAVPAALARRHGWTVGSTVTGEFTVTGYETMQVVAMVDGALPTGEAATVLLDRASLDQRLLPSARGDRALYVATTPGADPARVQATLATALAAFPTVGVSSLGAYADAQTSAADALSAVISGLLLVALGIGFLGIANTLVLALHERVREIGVLRAVGMQRAQVRRMVQLEALVLAVIGAAAGVGIGLAGGWALARLAAGPTTMATVVPWGRLVAAAATAVVLALVASAGPARRAARLPVLDALASPG